jgi:hypothetical protein
MGLGRMNLLMVKVAVTHAQTEKVLGQILLMSEQSAVGSVMDECTI